MPEVPSNMQHGVASLELEANNTMYRQNSTASMVSPVHGQFADRGMDNQGYGGAAYGQADGGYNHQNHNGHPERTSSQIPLRSQFPPPLNAGPNVPPSDEQKEEDLEHSREAVLNSNDPERQLNWAQAALHWSDNAIQSRIRAAVGAGNVRPTTPNIERRIREDALQVVNFLADQGHPKADFLRSTWYEFGKFGYTEDTKEAFAGYRRAADKKYSRAEYRMGTKYEAMKDMPHAIKHYQHGVAMGDSASCYRMGMMALLGQHGQPQNYETAVGQIRYAAETADENAPQGAYIYGMLLARELPNIILPDFVLPYDVEQARQFVERAAFLGFAKAQLKMGSAYELCLLGCEFNPTLSMHYNRLAAGQGEPEAEMAVSKWFLCGYEGVFSKNEDLAFQYAKRAAQQEFPTAEFALGYFYELGLHCPMDLGKAREWYQKAADHGNADALARLSALSMQRTLSRKDHENVAINRIRSQYGSRRGQRPDHLQKKITTAALPAMTEVNSPTSANFPPRSSSATVQGQGPVNPPFRVVTPVPDTDRMPGGFLQGQQNYAPYAQQKTLSQAPSHAHSRSQEVPPFRVVPPTPIEDRRRASYHPGAARYSLYARGRNDRGSDLNNERGRPRARSQKRSSSGNLLTTSSGQEQERRPRPAAPNAAAPYPEEDMRRRMNDMAVSGPPSDRCNSAFGVRPLHDNHDLRGGREGAPRLNPQVSSQSVPTQGRQPGSQPPYRGQTPTVPDVQKRDEKPTTKDWEHQYRVPFQGEPAKAGGPSRLQKQGPGGPQQPSKGAGQLAEIRADAPRMNQQPQRVPDGSNRPVLEQRMSGGGGYGQPHGAHPGQPRAASTMPPNTQDSLHPQHQQQRPGSSGHSYSYPDPQRPASADGRGGQQQNNYQGGLGVNQFPERRGSALPPAASQAQHGMPGVQSLPVTMISPAPSPKPSAPPPKKGPQTFDEMGVPPAPGEKECVSGIHCVRYEKG